jgi:bleomycin hydrolase
MKKVIGCLLWLSCFSVLAQETRTNKEEGGFTFSNFVEVGATEVKNQYRSGTCWSFGGLSLFESELIRMGLDSVNLSEMYIVRKAYEMKAERYVRMHGKAQFGPGGQFHDILNVVKEYGILPESQYGGQPVFYDKPVHAELDAMAKAMLNVVVKNPNRTLSPYWNKAYNGMLDAYLGSVPPEVKPKEFASNLGIDWGAYIELTSFTHMPFYEQSVLLIPDNWNYSEYYNVPLNDLYETVISSLDAGFSVGWDADVSEKTFSFKNGVAIYPETEYAAMSKAQRDTLFDKPSTEKIVSQEERQVLFDNYATTDDHLMHITGYCRDQNGTLYFVVKNSWGTDKNQCGGYIYVTEAYFKAKTIAIMLHKDGLNKGLAKKLKL